MFWVNPVTWCVDVVCQSDVITTLTTIMDTEYPIKYVYGFVLFSLGLGYIDSSL